MKKEKIIILIFFCLSIILPLILYSSMFPNMYVGTKINVTNNSYEYTLELEEKVISLLKKYQLSGGVAISVISNYELAWIKGFGHANEILETPITNDTYFQIASMSKSFCAWGVMNLYEDGLINLDDPVDNYLTRWNLPDTDFNNSEVTIRRILSHTAGLSLESFMGYETANEVLTIEEALAEVKVIIEPGSKWMYSGGGFLILQLLIEEVSGQNYTSYITNNILSPLNLTHSRTDWSTDIQNLIATAYDPSGNALPNYRFTALAAGGHYSTIIDLTNFIIANMNGSEGEHPGRGVLNESSIELMQSKIADVHPYMGGYGLGFQIKYLSNGQKMVYHNGQNTGFIGTMNIIPESGEGLVILTSSDAAKSLITELDSKWQQMIQGNNDKLLLNSKYLITILPIIALFLILTSISIWLIIALNKGRRQLVFQKKIIRLIISCILGILLIVSIILFYAPLKYRSGFAFVYWFLPEIHWLILMISISLLYFLTLTLTLSSKIKLNNIDIIEL